MQHIPELQEVNRKKLVVSPAKVNMFKSASPQTWHLLGFRFLCTHDGENMFSRNSTIVVHRIVTVMTYHTVCSRSEIIHDFKLRRKVKSFTHHMPRLR